MMMMKKKKKKNYRILTHIHIQRLRLFFLHMAINHTVIVDKKEDGTIELSASSPDEQAFVAGSFCQGVEFQGMNYDNNMITLNILGK